MANWPTAVALAAGAALVTFCVRAAPRLGRRQHGVDTWFHLQVADVARRRRRGEAAELGFLLGDACDYPPLLCLVLSRVPRALAERCQWAVSPLVDAVHGALALVLGAWLWHDALAGVLAWAVYLLSPVALEESTELSPRSPGALFVSAALGAGVLFQQTGQWPWAVAAALGVAGTMLVHRMSLQATLAATLALSVATASPAYLIVLAGGAALGLLLSGGGYLAVARGHLAELGFWRTHVHRCDHGDPLRLLLAPRPPAPAKRRGLKGYVSAVYGLVKEQPFVAMLPAAYLLGLGSHAAIPLTPYVAWAAALYLAFLATTYLRPLRFLGEGYRYLLYAGLPVSLVAAGYATVARSAPWWLHLLMGALALVGIREMIRHAARARRSRAATLSDDLRVVLDRIRELPRDGVICVPFALASAAAYFTGKSVLRHCGATSLGPLGRFYPLVTEPLDALAREFGASYILLDEAYSRGQALEIAGAREIGREGPYHLYEVEERPAAARAEAASGRVAQAEAAR